MLLSDVKIPFLEEIALSNLYVLKNIDAYISEHNQSQMRI